MFEKYHNYFLKKSLYLTTDVLQNINSYNKMVRCVLFTFLLSRCQQRPLIINLSVLTMWLHKWTSMTYAYHRPFPYAYQKHYLYQCIGAICSTLSIPLLFCTLRGGQRSGSAAEQLVEVQCRAWGRFSKAVARWIRGLNTSPPVQGRSPSSPCRPAVTPTYMKMFLCFIQNFCFMFTASPQWADPH